MATDFEEGLLVGILVGEGHFGGDGRQPHVTLRMHERHAPLFRWIERTVPGGRLYGPYDHGGRRYLQWMARGAFLRDVLVPILDRCLTPEIDAHAYGRYAAMRAQYQRQLGRHSAQPAQRVDAPEAGSDSVPPAEQASGRPAGTAEVTGEGVGLGGADASRVSGPGPSTEGDTVSRIFSSLRRTDDRS